MTPLKACFSTDVVAARVSFLSPKLDPDQSLRVCLSEAARYSDIQFVGNEQIVVVVQNPVVSSPSCF